MKIKAYYFYFLIVLTSCSSLKFSKNENTLQVNKLNYDQVNGIYFNNNLDTTLKDKTTLWSMLHSTNDKKYHNKAVVYKDEKLHLKFENKKTLFVKLYNGDSLIKEKRIKGKIKGGYFFGRRKVKYFGLPFIFVKVSQLRYRICKGVSNNLIVDIARENMAGIFIFFAGANFYSTYTFERSNF